MNNKYKSVRNERIGEIHKLNCGATAKIIDYKNWNNVKVLILENGEIRDNLRYSHLKDGNIKLLYFPTAFGVGYLGEMGLTTNYSKSDSYKYWRAMLQRCYGENLQERWSSYSKATVCEEWHNYSNFKEWFDKNYYEVDGERMHLEKDILIKNNKIYSPNTCVFSPERINYLFVNSINSKRKNVLGVSFDERHRKYQVQHYKLKINNNVIYIRNKKYFKELTEAFLHYKKEKEKCIKIVADYYKDKIPQKLYDALYKWEVEIND